MQTLFEVYDDKEDNESPEKSSGPIELTADDLPNSSGTIDATTAWKIGGEPEELGRMFFLPQGEVMEVPKGKAFFIKEDDDQWNFAQFYDAGKMTGPLVYAEADILDPREAVKRYEGVDVYIPLVVGVPAIIGTACFIIRFLMDADKAVVRLDLLVIALMALIFVIGLAFIRSYYKIAITEKGAIKYFRKHKANMRKSFRCSYTPKKDLVPNE